MSTFNRRQFLQTGLAYSLGLSSTASLLAEEPAKFLLPAEWSKHHSTWLTYGTNHRFAGKDFLPAVRKNLILLAQTIAKYEPVSMLVRPPERARAQELLAGAPVKLIEQPLGSLWGRDSLPTLLINTAGAMRAVDFHFSGWDQLKGGAVDAKLASFLAEYLKLERLEAELKLPASCLEVDGMGTAILTEAGVFYAGHNTQLSKIQIENRLQRLLGIEKIIWMPGNAQGSLAALRTDYYTRFVKSGTVLVSHEPNPKLKEHTLTLKHQEILSKATDATGKPLEMIVVNKPFGVRLNFINSSFASSYLGFYMCNGAVIMQEFGDALSDNAARRSLQAIYPERKIELLNMDALASGSASIHSVTRQQPAL